MDGVEAEEVVAGPVLTAEGRWTIARREGVVLVEVAGGSCCRRGRCS